MLLKILLIWQNISIASVRGYKLGILFKATNSQPKIFNYFLPIYSEIFAIHQTVTKKNC